MVPNTLENSVREENWILLRREQWVGRQKKNAIRQDGPFFEIMRDGSGTLYFKVDKGACKSC